MGVRARPGIASLFCSDGVANGARTHDPQIHNLVLCQLSYGHREKPAETNGEFTIHRRVPDLVAPALVPSPW